MKLRVGSLNTQWCTGSPARFRFASKALLALESCAFFLFHTGAEEFNKDWSQSVIKIPQREKNLYSVLYEHPLSMY